MRKLVAIVGLVGALLTAGCATVRTSHGPAEGGEIDAINASLREAARRHRMGAPGDYVIDPPDVISVYVRDTEVRGDREIQVGPDGKVSLPWVGVVQVSGRTVAEVTEELRGRYATYIRDPEVTVTVVRYQSKWVYVDGEVLRPGRYPYTGSDSTVNALSQAGFLTRRASPNGIHVARGNPNDPEIYPVRYKDIALDDDSRTNWKLEPEDIVYVPPTFLSRVGYIFEEILFPFSFLYSPAQGYATYDQVR
jgi:polysaccharide biosynthesis/export protein